MYNKTGLGFDSLLQEKNKIKNDINSATGPASIL